LYGTGERLVSRSRVESGPLPSYLLSFSLLPLYSGALPRRGPLFFMMNMELPLRNKPLNDNSYGIELIRFGGQYVMSDRPPTSLSSFFDPSAPLE
jgi:hypothetical protein